MTNEASLRTDRHNRKLLSNILGEGDQRAKRIRLLVTGDMQKEIVEALNEVGAATPQPSIETQVATMAIQKWTYKDIQCMRNMGLQVHSVKEVQKFHKAIIPETNSEVEEVWNSKKHKLEVVHFGGWKDINNRIIGDAMASFETKSLVDIASFPLSAHNLPGECIHSILYMFNTTMQPNSKLTVGRILVLSEAEENLSSLHKYLFVDYLTSLVFLINIGILALT